MKIKLGELKKIINEVLIADYAPSGGKGGSFGGQPISEWDTDAVMNAWSKHVGYYYELMFYLKNGTTEEKTEASNELAICDRKLSFWERHPQFDVVRARVIVKELAAGWDMEPMKLGRTRSPASTSTSFKDTFSSPLAMAAPGSKGAKRVSHSKFGTGTIVKSLDGDKVQVVFDDKSLGGVAKTLSMSFLTPVT